MPNISEDADKSDDEMLSVEQMSGGMIKHDKDHFQTSAFLMKVFDIHDLNPSSGDGRTMILI